MSDRALPSSLPRTAAVSPAGVPRVVIITGGSSGIGRCTAGLFARRGWSVGLIARGLPGLQAALEDVRAAGATGAVAVADVADADALEQAARALTAQLGPADAWINAAGNGVYGRLLDVPDAEFRRVTDVTYMGTVNGVRAALRIMLPRDSGAIVNVCSGIVFHGLPLMSSYVGAKAAVRGFGQSIQVELKLARSRVRLATIFPPAVNTPFFSHAPSYMGFPARPVPPVYQPEIVAEALYLAATGRCREMTVTSVVTAFSLVARLSPALAAWLMGRLRFDAQLSRDPAALAAEEPCLFRPPSRVLGVRGPFNQRARGWSAQVRLLGLLQRAASLLSVGPAAGTAPPASSVAGTAPPAPGSPSRPAPAASYPAPACSDAPADAASGRPR